MCPHDKVCTCCTNLEKKPFVRYRFPKAVNTIYEKDFTNFRKVGGKPEAFSNEREWANLVRSAQYPLGIKPKNIVEEEQKHYELVNKIDP